jgi:hypothetical protein
MGTPTISSYTNISESTNVTSFQVTLPSSTAAGDLLVAIIAKDDDPSCSSSNSMTTLKGIVGSDYYSVVFTKIAVAEDITRGYMEFTGDSETYVGKLYRVTFGGDSGVISISSGTEATGTSAAPYATTMTAAKNSLVFAFAGMDDDDVPYACTTGGWTAEYNTSATDCGIIIVTKYFSTSGATGQVDFTTNASDGWGGVQFYVSFNAVPTIVLTTPADDAILTDTTPDLKFTGTDADSDTLEYEVLIDTSSDFEGQVLTNQTIDEWTLNDGYYQLWTSQYLLGRGQTFTPTKNGTITHCTWRMARMLESATGYMYACVYSYPGATLLGTSDAVYVPDILDYGHYEPFYFTGDNQVDIVNTNQYMIGFTWDGWTEADQIAWMVDDTQSKPNSITMQCTVSSGWTSTTWDLNYYVYGTTREPLYYKKSVLEHATFTTGHPYASGTEIAYTPPTLTGPIYYWKVRTYDPLGSNIYSSWTTARHFHYSTQVTTSVHVYTTGDVPRSNTSVYVAGTSTALSDTQCYISGQSVLSSSTKSYMYGIASALTNISAYVSSFPEPAFQSTAFQTDAFQALGLWVGFAHAYLNGDSSLPSAKTSTDVYVTGIANDLSSQDAYLHGKALSNSSIDIYLSGKSLSSTSIHAYIASIVNILAGTPVYTKGHILASSNIDAYIEGSGSEVNDSTSAFVYGEVAIDSSQKVYLTGSEPPVDTSTQAYLAGGVNISSQTQCYMFGLVLLTSSSDVFTSGNILTTGSTHAFIGSLTEDVQQSQHAYLFGISRSSSHAYLSGQIVSLDYIWLKTNDGTTKAKKFIILREDYMDGDKAKTDSVVHTISGGIDQSTSQTDNYWNLIVRVKQTESEPDYGNLADLEYFYELRNPTAVPSNTIIFINHHQYEYLVHIIGKMTKNLIGTQVEGQEAIYLYHLQLVEVG